MYIKMLNLSCCKRINMEHYGFRLKVLASYIFMLRHFRELNNYIFMSTPTDTTRGILEYSRDLLGTVRKNPRNGKRKIDILLYANNGASGAAGYHRNTINLKYWNNLVGSRRIERFAYVVAHEYVHSIHLAYSTYPTFFREGLATWVSRDIILNEQNMFNSFTSIYFIHSIHYRNKPLFQSRPFLYDHALLFISYLAQRIGIENIKHIIQVCQPGGVCDADNPDNGDWYHDRDDIEGLDYALSSINPDLTLQKIVIDYHTTNLVNDPAVVLNGIEYGYEAIKYTRNDFKIHPDIIVDFHNSSFSQKTIELKTRRR